MRYRLIDVRIWGDSKFKSLSPLKPNGQALFIYLLTNPNTNSIPGLYRAGAAAMAEELGWNLKDFLEAFQEVLDQGLVKADLKARLIFIPNAIKYNKPQSPNVVKSWASHWDELPECELKTIAYQALKAFCEGLGEGYVKAFDKTIIKTMPNQEQDQEQKQDQEIHIPQVANATCPVSLADFKNKVRINKKNSVESLSGIKISSDQEVPSGVVGGHDKNDPIGRKSILKHDGQLSSDDDVGEVFSHWKQIMNHPKAKLDDKRKRKISYALSKLNFTVADCQLAIEGCSRSAYHMGDNPQKQRYDGIDLIFRDSEHIEKFIEIANRNYSSASINCSLPGVKAPDASLFEGVL